MQVGIDSFAAAFDENSRAVNPAERLRQLVKQIEHADEVGLDAFGVGEHHRREFLDSAPAVILGAAAARTQHIRLTSAVTVLSAEDRAVVGEPSVVPEGVFPDRSRNGRGIEVETRSLAGGAPTLRRWVTGGRTWRAYSRSAKLFAIPAHAGHLSPARNERGHARRGASPRSVVGGRCADPGVRWPASRWKARREPEKNGCDRRVQVSWSAALRSQSLLSCRKSSIVPHSTGTGPNGMASPRFVPDDCMALPRDSYSGRSASSASWITTVANCHPALVFCNK